VHRWSYGNAKNGARRFCPKNRIGDRMELMQRIFRTAISRPLRLAVIDDFKRWRSYQLLIGALHLARAIERSSDRPRIGVMLPTSGLFPMAAMATWMLGRTLVPLNYLLNKDELEFIIDDAELDVVITVKAMVEFVGGLPGSVKQIRIDELSFGGIPPVRRCARRDDDFESVILYTSGTSGRPKGVMLTGSNLLANIDQCREWAGFTRDDTMLGVLPQFHSFGLTVLTLLPLTVGCRAVYTARFVPRRIVELLREHRPTAFVAIPSMYNALRTVREATADDFTSLRYAVSGGEPLPEAVFEGFRDRFGVTINEGYGLTETAPVSTWCRPQEHRRRSVGRTLPKVEIRIIDPDGNEVAQGEDGEIRIKGPNVMKGYFRRPDDTAAVFDEEGWFRTGDMGRIDEDGHLFITGRIKEMLIIGGENVFPREIEEILNRHPSVKDSAVIGLDDEIRGEVPLAFVELNEGAEFDATAIKNFCRKHLAGYKTPREVRCVDALPRNATGKVMRRQLKAEGNAESNAEC